MTRDEFYQDVPGLEIDDLRSQTTLDPSSVFIRAILERRHGSGSLIVRRALGSSGIRLSSSPSIDRAFVVVDQGLRTSFVWEGPTDPDRDSPFHERRSVTSEVADFGSVEEVTLSDGRLLWLNTSPANIGPEEQFDLMPSSISTGGLMHDDIHRIARDLDEAEQTIIGIGKFLGLSPEDAALSAQLVLHPSSVEGTV